MENVRARFDKYIKTICEYFSNNGYTCSINYPLRKRHIKFIADVLCKRERERVIIEFKEMDFINKSAIKNLVLYSMVFDDAKWYLCIPSTTKLKPGVKSFLEQNGIGLIYIEDSKVKIAWTAVPYVTLNTSYNTLIKDLRELLKPPTERRSRKPELDVLYRSYFYRDSRTDFINTIRSCYETLLTFQKKVNQMNLFLKRSAPIKLRIPSKLLDYVNKLENISYSEELMEFSKKYKKITAYDEEYQLILSTLNKLWAKYQKERGAMAFKLFKEFEPLLKGIPDYRDHLLHPFQVFLMGSIIIDKFYEDFRKAYKQKMQNASEDLLDFVWLLCATFHDFCYPIQMYELVNKRLFKNFLQIEDDSLLPKLETEKIILQRGQLKLVDQLVSLLCHYMQGPKNEWVFDSECKIDDEFRFLILQEIAKKNHAPLGALALLNMILREKVATSQKRYIDTAFSTAVYPAALAIALHDKEILKKLPEDKNILFEHMPLALLLIYCDTAQEFGRARYEETCTLKNMNLDLGQKLVETSLIFSQKSVFNKKDEECECVFQRLKSKSIIFKIHLTFGSKEISFATSNA